MTLHLPREDAGNVQRRGVESRRIGRTPRPSARDRPRPAGASGQGSPTVPGRGGRSWPDPPSAPPAIRSTDAMHRVLSPRSSIALRKSGDCSACASGRRALSSRKASRKSRAAFSIDRAASGRGAKSFAAVSASLRVSRASSTSCDGGYAFAEEQAGGFRQLMRFVEDHRVAGRQQFAHAVVAQHHIGEKQVMIDHHHVGVHRGAPRGKHEALLVVRTLLAQAVVPRRSNRTPGSRILGHGGAFGFVAASGLPGKARNRAQVCNVLPTCETAIDLRTLEMVVA